MYDAKRRKIELNDTIIFINRDQPGQSIEVRVIGLLQYLSFHELFISSQPQKFGGSSVEQLEKQIDKFYSFDEQKKYGVIWN